MAGIAPRVGPTRSTTIVERAIIAIKITGKSITTRVVYTGIAPIIAKTYIST